LFLSKHFIPTQFFFCSLIIFFSLAIPSTSLYNTIIGSHLTKMPRTLENSLEHGHFSSFSRYSLNSIGTFYGVVLGCDFVSGYADTQIHKSLVRRFFLFASVRSCIRFVRSCIFWPRMRGCTDISYKMTNFLFVYLYFFICRTNKFSTWSFYLSHK